MLYEHNTHWHRKEKEEEEGKEEDEKNTWLFRQVFRRERVRARANDSME